MLVGNRLRHLAPIYWRLKKWNVNSAARVHADRQEQPRVEQQPEQAVVELQVHEVQDDGEELDRHHDQQQRQEERSEVVLRVAQRHLERR